MSNPDAPNTDNDFHYTDIKIEEPLVPKFILIANSAIVREEIDEKLLSRMYIVKCYGEFTPSN